MFVCTVQHQKQKFIKYNGMKNRILQTECRKFNSAIQKVCHGTCKNNLYWTDCVQSMSFMRKVFDVFKNNG